MAKIKIFLRGAYDSYNFGDDLIFIAILYFLEKNVNLKKEDVEIYIKKQKHSLEKLKWKFKFDFQEGKDFNADVICNINRKLKSLKLPRGIRIFVVACLFVLVLVDICIFRLTRKSIFFKDFVYFFRNLDILHYIGGGYINDWLKVQLINEWIMVNMAKMINPNLKIIGTGSGLGPFRYKFKLSLRFLKIFLNRFDRLFLRDFTSLRFVKGLKIKTYARCYGDDILLLHPLFQSLKCKKAKKNMAFNLKDFPDYDYSKLKKCLKDFLILVREKNFQVEYFCFGQKPGPDDYGLFKSLHIDDKISPLIMHNPYEEGVQAFIENLNRTNLGIGCAYHFNVILSMLSIPSMAIYSGNYYAQKIKGAEELYNIPFVFNINDVNAYSLEKSLKELLKKNYNISNNLEAMYKKMVDEYTILYKTTVNSLKS